MFVGCSNLFTSLMDKKTEELRDIFIDVADSDTITESQEESRGSLVSEPEIEERLEELISEMRDRYGFNTELTDEELCFLLEAVYDGYTDDEVADELDISADTVLRARLDLHLVRESDTETEFNVEEFRRRATAEDVSDEALAIEFNLTSDEVSHYRQIVEAQDESRRANDRYRDEFASLLDDADISGSLTGHATEDGLDDATEGMETDVSF